MPFRQRWKVIAPPTILTKIVCILTCVNQRSCRCRIQFRREQLSRCLTIYCHLGIQFIGSEPFFLIKKLRTLCALVESSLDSRYSESWEDSFQIHQKRKFTLPCKLYESISKFSYPTTDTLIRQGTIKNYEKRTYRDIETESRKTLKYSCRRIVRKLPIPLSTVRYFTGNVVPLKVSCMIG
uniref:AlNc14C464G11794 protein n=1 Tax=Albugo laibachii Nc14 TaxID=890382 RepID=F0X056_9STRA|nr:AlNc14C464G11794 [Albugo laibachii Nc14]|eukprot:CCA27138.1 AlNc14C464G11794 [Albugo laibachii Nc14]